MDDETTRRIKRRSGAWMSFVIGPVILVVTLLKVLESHDYPAGDIRNEPIFWAILAALAVILVAILIGGSIRELTLDSRERPPRA